jgi:YgiT-type zinc finger domain-containing protein
MDFCGHTHLTEERVRYIHQWCDDLLIVEGVPCLKCKYCGEQYFAFDVLKKIGADHAALAAHHSQPSRTVQVAVEEFRSR